MTSSTAKIASESQASGGAAGLAESGPTAEQTGDGTGSGHHDPRSQSSSSFGWKQVRQAIVPALRKLDPRVMAKTPVMFLVEVGALLVSIMAIFTPDVFTISIAIWLWLTVLFANLAEAIAEGRGKAQAESLKKTRTTSMATLIDASGATQEVSATSLKRGDRVVVVAGEDIPGDGDVIEGAATVDESAVTGESAPVIRESGGDRSAVTGGTRVLSDRIVIEITSEAGKTFVDKMIALVEGAARQKTPNEIALGILLNVLTLIFILVVATIQPMSMFSGQSQSLVVLIALLVCLIPTTVGALLSAIGIAGMDRLVQRNVLAMSGRAVEAAGDVNTLLLDKTGTITHGDRQASQLYPVRGVEPEVLARAAQFSSLADETPEGRSIVTLVSQRYSVAVAQESEYAHATFIPFTAQTRMSGIDFGDGHVIVKGASREVVAWVEESTDTSPGAVTASAPGAPNETGETSDPTSAQIHEIAEQVSSSGATALVVAEKRGNTARLLGVIELKDIVKDGLRERFEELRAMGIRTVMITGDNALTAKAIAAEAGVDDYLAEATPEDKLALIRKEQEGGKLVAMTGDGTNDAPALAQSDVGVAMNTGTSAAKEAGNMVDLDSDPTKLIDIVQIGKQLLITRGALTTFSIANDVAKYFAIIPSMFMGIFPGLAALNIMGLASPQSAILSAVIFNALIIVALIPLSLKGVRYRAVSASKLLSRNLLIYGLGGLIVPFIGIKAIDMLISLIPSLS